jgi:hypothetical protein
VARSRSAAVATAEAEFAEIVAWYEDLLERTYPPTDLVWEPVKIGPTWAYDAGWSLPALTLGWRVLAWCGTWLRDKTGKPWQFTAEQTRFVLWFFAVDETGDFIYHSAVLQRLKGWGKDPLAACIAVAGMFAEVTFDHWDADRPVGRDEPNAWVQLVAVAQEQTQNTMKLFPSLISPEARRYYGIQVGKLTVWGLNDTRQIQAVTSSPLAIEGGRPTLIVRNETQNWNSSNGGHDMAGAIEGNAAKSEDGAARMLDICNAYRPGEDSVAERTREGWEKTQGAGASHAEFGLLYDSLEAPPDAPLTIDDAPQVIDSIRGDSVWLSIKRIVKSILDPRNSPSESRRKWYNQIVAVADAWLLPQDIGAIEDPDAKLFPGEEVVAFFDGSKSDDATGLVVCRLSDGVVFRIGVWQRPVGWDRNAPPWRVPRGEVDSRVDWMFANLVVVAFYADPSHALDDEGERFWDGIIDGWHQRYSSTIDVKLWAVRTGDNRSAFLWDMTSPERTHQFTQAAERFVADVEERSVAFARDALMTQHLRNARRRPNRYGVSLGKEHRESARKVDLAVCAVGARMLRRVVLNLRATKKQRTGEAVFM